MSREKPSHILRGQMYYACLDPVIGSEQNGNRPVLIVQNDLGNLHSPTVIAAPITSHVKKMRLPTHIGIPSCYDLPERSMVLLEQIRTIDKRRLGEYIGCLDDDIMHCIDRAVSISVGLKQRLFFSWEPWEPTGQEHEDHEEMVLCLCPICASQFFNSPDHVIRRISSKSAPMETCTYCDVRLGHTYRVFHKRKRLGDDRP